jgi:CDGSH-type Zn-finger protein
MALKNGPLEVSGSVQLLDADGKPVPAGDDPVYLCRCGRSSNKPFCDGSHKKAGFEG